MAIPKNAENDARIQRAFDRLQTARKEVWDEAGKISESGKVIAYTRRRREADAMMVTWLVGRLTRAEYHLEQLESRLAQQHNVGTWTQGASYKCGNSVSHDGSIWICTEDTDRKPGTANSGFVLAVKKGRDAREAKR